MTQAEGEKTPALGHGTTPPLAPLADTLVRVGVSRERALRSLSATGYRGLDLATQWLTAHISDPVLDQNDHDRTFFIQLSPKPLSALYQRLIIFRNSTQWNKSHGQPFHINLGSFKVNDAHVPQAVEAVRNAMAKHAGDFAAITSLGLEKFHHSISQGLCPGKSFEAFLRGLTDTLKLNLRSLQVDLDQADDYRLFLAQGFHPAHAQHLGDQIKKLNVKSDPSDYELRLYSSDPRLRQPDADVYRVTAPVTMSSHAVKGMGGVEATELCMDDMVVPTTNTTSDNATDYVTVTSWLTGKSGKVPPSVLQRACHSNVWTLHLSISCVKTQHNCTPHPSSLDLSSLVESLRGLSQDLGGKTAATFQIDTPTRNKRSDRQIYIVRHGERVDYSFGKHWMNTCFDGRGRGYQRRDLNMPLSVPTRNGGLDAWARDCPLTRIGEIQAELTGEAMRDANVKISHVFASPSLRCVQTAHHILKGLGCPGLKIHVEPGLFEWLGWYAEGMPDWLSIEELAAHGYNVDESYCPYIPSDGLKDTWHQSNEPETAEQFYERNSFVTQCIIQRTEGQGGNLLLVAHAVSGDTCSRQVTGRDPRSQEQMHQISRLWKVGYCGVTVLQEEEEALSSSSTKSQSVLRNSSESLNSRRSFHPPAKKKVWKLREPPFPPLTGVQVIPAGQQSADWRVLLENDTEANIPTL